MPVYRLDKTNFDKFALKGTCVVDVCTTSDSNCTRFYSEFYRLSDEMKDIKFYTLESTQNKEIMDRYGIKTVPTVLVIKEGQVVGMGEGNVRKEELKSHIEQALKNAAQ